jgi:molybdopterin molybdotransferase
VRLARDGTLGVDEARERILAALSPLAPVALPPGDALALTLAADVAARWDLPPFANSAMDGYALRTADTAGAAPDAPVALRVTGHAPAGYVPDTPVEPGCAIRIMTGAPIPAGADAVVRFEDTGEHAGPSGIERIDLRRPARASENIRPAGEDARRGETVLRAGTRLRASEIALLAAVGESTATVHRRPRVGVLVTGDEVVEPGGTPAAGQIFNSNGPMVEALVRQCGGEPVMLGVAADTVDAVRDRIAAAAGTDLLITTGGVSVGDFDVVKDALRAEGQVALWKIRIKPGKPLAFGRLGGVPMIGLPGNPVAAAIAFWQFAQPAILTLLGRRDPRLPEIEATVRDRIENRGGRQQFVRVHVERSSGGYVATVAGAQGSAILTSLARANGLLVIPEDVDLVQPGTIVTIQMPDWDLPA